MKFILTRHCETDWNKEWLLQGHSDISLNENGWLQAEELAKNRSSELRNDKTLAKIEAEYKLSDRTSLQMTAEEDQGKKDYLTVGPKLKF